MSTATASNNQLLEESAKDIVASQAKIHTGPSRFVSWAGQVKEEELDKRKGIMPEEGEVVSSPIALNSPSIQLVFSLMVLVPVVKEGV